MKQKRSELPGSSPRSSKRTRKYSTKPLNSFTFILRREFRGIIVYQNCLVSMTTSVLDQATRTVLESRRPMF